MTAEEALDALRLLLDLHQGAEWEQVVWRITALADDYDAEVASWGDDDC